MASVKTKKNSTAIFAVTSKGADLGRRLNILLPRSRLILTEKNGTEFERSLKESVQEAFGEYRYLVLIMAVGIAVRIISPVLKAKYTDPGVVVIDDSGKFAVSLLSGHVGGANDLALKAAACIGAVPVITTASDGMGTLPVDILGAEFGWEIQGRHNLTKVAADLIQGRPVGLCQETGESGWLRRDAQLPSNIHRFRTTRTLSKANRTAALLITDRILSESERTLLPQHTITYRPKSLVIGIGCNRGTAAGVIEEAVTAVLSTNGLSVESIRQLATIDRKKDEPGLLEFSRKKGLRIDFFESASLANAAFPSPVSQAALKHVGAPAVCESAAILSSGGGRIIVPKTSYKKAVTVSVARISYARQPARAKGKVYIIGIGPGDISQITLRAREAIDLSDVILGYTAYMKLIESLLGQKKEVKGSGMGAEVARARQAIDLAKRGKIVSVVSSGDAGIYGMAGLVAEIIAEYPGDPVDMEVIPGVPAFVAASALLGAPLVNDFVSISLSDHLIPWNEIRDRLKLAARGDFVIVLYNPKSKKRPLHLARAGNIILKCRPPSTPVGVVTNAYRPGQQVIITDLEHMLDWEIGMNTVIVIGNSQTFVSGGRLITRRGYQNKYTLGQTS